ncbi:MAG: hypothetical protein ACKVU1_13900 [bacterium]
MARLIMAAVVTVLCLGVIAASKEKNVETPDGGVDVDADALSPSAIAKSQAGNVELDDPAVSQRLSTPQPLVGAASLTGGPNSLR